MASLPSRSGRPPSRARPTALFQPRRPPTLSSAFRGRGRSSRRYRRSRTRRPFSADRGTVVPPILHANSTRTCTELLGYADGAVSVCPRTRAYSGARLPAVLLTCRSRVGADERDHLLREPFHLVVLRTELQQQQVHTRVLEPENALGDLLGRPCEARLQPTVRHRIILEAHLLFELGVGQPFVIGRVARCALAHVRDAGDLPPGRCYRRAAHDVARDPEFQGWEPAPLAPPPHVRHLGRDPLRRIAVHQIGVAGLGDQLLCRLRFTTGVDPGPRPRYRLGLEDRVLHAVVLPREGEARLGPHAADHLEPLAGAAIARVVLIELHAVLARLVGPPGRHHIEREPPPAAVVDVRRLFRAECWRMK